MKKDQEIATKNIQRVIELCYEMLELADYGDNYRQDEGCGVVYGTLRDAAYKVRKLAEKEQKSHERKKKTER